MRPKMVVLTLVIAIGLTVLAGVVKKSMSGSHAPDMANTPGSRVGDAAPPPATASRGASNNPAIVEQMREADVVRELDQVRELQATGAGDEKVVALLVARVTHTEPKVREAAIAALVQLNDTNAIPGLEQALGLTQDSRDKASLEQAIEYLKLPSATPAELPPATADAASAPSTPVGASRQDRPSYQRIQRARAAAAAVPGTPVPASRTKLSLPSQRPNNSAKSSLMRLLGARTGGRAFQF